MSFLDAGRPAVTKVPKGERQRLDCPRLVTSRTSLAGCLQVVCLEYSSASADAARRRTLHKQGSLQLPARGSLASADGYKNRTHRSLQLPDRDGMCHFQSALLRRIVNYPEDDVECLLSIGSCSTSGFTSLPQVRWKFSTCISPHLPYLCLNNPRDRFQFQAYRFQS